jgi:hypothetical protein
MSVTIKETVEEVLAKNKRLIEEDSQKLSDFIEEMQREGFLIKKQYDLPPLDSMGREFCSREKNENVFQPKS